MNIRVALNLTNVRWRTTFFVGVATVLIYAPFVFSRDVGIFFFTLLILCSASAITSIMLLVGAFSLRKSSLAAGLVVNGVTITLVSVTMFFVTPFYSEKTILALENKALWMMDKKKYKEALRSQPPQRNELSHILFRLWGFVGGTDVCSCSTRPISSANTLDIKVSFQIYHAQFGVSKSCRRTTMQSMTTTKSPGTTVLMTCDPGRHPRFAIRTDFADRL